MSSKWKMLGVRFPEDSNMPARFKTRSIESRMSYYELIEHWLDRDENEKGQLTFTPLTDTSESPLASRVAELEKSQNILLEKIEKYVQKALMLQDKEEKPMEITATTGTTEKKEGKMTPESKRKIKEKAKNYAKKA
jgi:hypothetical protein